MALIVRHYLDYFVYGRESRFSFQRGEVSYFDPVERQFLRITPSKGEAAQQHWIPLPVIRESDAFRNYLRLSANTTLLQDYADLEEIDFCIKVIEAADKYDFEDELWGYVTCYYNEILMKWIEDNHIPNCKVRGIRPLIEIHTREDAKRVYDLIGERLRAEEQQEEEFKKTFRKSAAD